MLKPVIKKLASVVGEKKGKGSSQQQKARLHVEALEQREMMDASPTLAGALTVPISHATEMQQTPEVLPIVDGTNTTKGQFPTVGIVWAGEGEWSHDLNPVQSSGVLISDTHVLTVAHGVLNHQNQTPHPAISFELESGKSVKVKKVHLHHETTNRGTGTGYYWADIAILELEKPVTQLRGHRNLTPSPLHQGTLNQGTKLTLVGYGKGRYVPLISYPVKASGDNDVKHVENDTPNNHATDWTIQWDKQPGEATVEGGDSGGAVFVQTTHKGKSRYELAGVIKGGFQANANAPMTYTATRVDHFADWISEVMTGTIEIDGTNQSDKVVVDYKNPRVKDFVTVTFNGKLHSRHHADAIDLIRFTGNGGKDRFVNNTHIASWADGGKGRDVLIGGSGDDTLIGGGGRDRLVGNQGHDLLDGSAGNDLLKGGAGNDTLVGGNGKDVLNGGKGDDHYEMGQRPRGHVRINDRGGHNTLDLSQIRTGVEVDLSKTGRQKVASGFELTLASARSIQVVKGTDFNDRLVGNHLDNRLEGGGGNDTLVASGGNDILWGFHGDDTYEFNGTVRGHTTIWDLENTNTLDFDSLNDRVRVDLSITTAQRVNSNLTITLGANDAIDHVVGTRFDDVLIGNDLNNNLDGKRGDDTLNGGNGDDRLWGWFGDDTYQFDGRARGVKRILDAKDEGVNTLDFRRMTSGVVVDIAMTREQTAVGKLKIDLLAGNMITTVLGTPYQDFIQGNELTNKLYGFDGDDWLRDNSGGDDRLSGGEGDDRLEAGGTGLKRLYGDAGDDELLDVSKGEDRLYGGEGNDLLEVKGSDYSLLNGGNGNDVLKAEHKFAHADLYGEGGNDYFTVYTGDPRIRIDGGSGRDFAEDVSSSNDVENIRIRDASWTHLGFFTDPVPQAQIDNGVLVISGNDRAETVVVGNEGNYLSVTYNGRQKLFTSSSVQQIKYVGKGGDDRFVNQTSIAASIYGGAGNDTLIGGSGNDYVEGGTGHDLIRGGAGDDAMTGGRGNDYLSGGSGNDRLHGAAGNDRLEGNSGNDILVGEAGHDQIRGGAGDDFAYGGDGNDRIHGGAGNDVLVGGDGHDHLQGDAGNDFLVGGNHNDVLIGGAGNDLLRGEAGNDRLRGEAGNDRLEGGSGNDRLEGGRGNDALFGQDGHDHLEGGRDHDHLNGGNGNDYLAGGSGNDRLQGGSGNDRLDGNQGNDTLLGEAGHDQIRGGIGNDFVDGGTGNDRIYGGGGNDVLVGGHGHDHIQGDAGNDHLHGGDHNDVLIGGAGNDLLRGDSGNDRLLGEAGHDRLEGGVGHDVLNGGRGNDVLHGGLHNDLLVGGAGNDYLDGGTGNNTLNGGTGHDQLVGQRSAVVRRLENVQQARKVNQFRPRRVRARRR